MDVEQGVSCATNEVWLRQSSSRVEMSVQPESQDMTGYRKLMFSIVLCTVRRGVSVQRISQLTSTTAKECLLRKSTKYTW